MSVVKVLIVDDSAVTRRALSLVLSQEKEIEVVGTAVDAYAARDKVVRLQPDVVTLDIEMPRMNGLTFLQKLMKYHPLPVVVVSSFTPEGSEMAVRALELGAVDVICKPSAKHSIAEITGVLAEKVRAAASAGVAKRPSTEPRPQRADCQTGGHQPCSEEIVAIGASTGGPEAIKRILLALDACTPGALIVQHMPGPFITAFAKRLGEQCAIEVREARDREQVLPGLALLAPGDHHLVLRREGNAYFTELKKGPRVHHQRPSVDVLFHSVAREAGAKAIGVILTGMGCDGVEGLQAIRQAGGYTIAQDEGSSVVFGMPKQAILSGAAQHVVPLDEIPAELLKAVGRTSGD